MEKVHFSSATDQWSTPPDFMARLEQRFGRFDLDPCADATNAKAPIYFDRSTDGLTQDWLVPPRDAPTRVFMNPPYGRGIDRWMRKAYESAEAGALVVCLVPARTCSRWWHDYAMKGEIHLIKGRLRFGGAAVNAPFPSAVVVFWPPSLRFG